MEQDIIFPFSLHDVAATVSMDTSTMPNEAHWLFDHILHETDVSLLDVEKEELSPQAISGNMNRQSADLSLCFDQTLNFPIVGPSLLTLSTEKDLVLSEIDSWIDLALKDVRSELGLKWSSLQGNACRQTHDFKQLFGEKSMHCVERNQTPQIYAFNPQNWCSETTASNTKTEVEFSHAGSTHSNGSCQSQTRFDFGSPCSQHSSNDRITPVKASFSSRPKSVSFIHLSSQPGDNTQFTSKGGAELTHRPIRFVYYFDQGKSHSCRKDNSLHQVRGKIQKPNNGKKKQHKRSLRFSSNQYEAIKYENQVDGRNTVRFVNFVPHFEDYLQ
ncbi:hypothetical protein C9374_000434 [Naegleria lovaniensis]|uniref:Uncharacterized protein n=1 Tax=Naegleria lovaniensis TaxID=51637 RepID=A0AA88KLU4_NAELO|nr:uncharacterized protein C9374_000434 [Naegleria lovaniensis]KAG2388270.1 hypothetical protein C9374_000434 [Naegleria lovaniensis]